MMQQQPQVSPRVPLEWAMSALPKVSEWRSEHELRLGSAVGLSCKTRENSNFWKNGKIVISVKTRNFSRSRMMKRISPLESSREI